MKIKQLILHPYLHISLALLYVAYHLFTLSLSPIVWQDETFFNALTLDFIKNGTFYQTNCPLFLEGVQQLYYGPVFFILNGIVLEVFGNNPFQGRILGLICGFAVLFMITVFYKKKFEKKNLFFVLVLSTFFLDPFFNASLHKGRMDTLALVFYFLSFFVFIKNTNAVKHWKYFLLSALLFTLSVLTSSRMLVFVLPFLFVFIYLFIQHKPLRKNIFINALVWGISFFTIYSVWIFKAFGSFAGFLDYYAFLSKQMPSHLFGHLFIPVEEYPLIILTLILLGLSLLKNRILFTRSQTIFYLGYIFTYYLLIGDVGPYSVLVIPFYYMIFMEIFLANKELNKKNKLVSIVLVLLLCFNLGIFVFKSAIVTLNYSSRNYSSVTNTIKKVIPEGSRVIADEVYYYAVIANNCKFQYMHLHIDDLIKVEKYRREVFDYQYLILSKRLINRNPGLMPLYTKNANLKLIGEIKSQDSELLKKLAKLGIYDFSAEAYEGEIYMRIP